MYAKEKRPPGGADEREEDSGHTGRAVRFDAQRLNAASSSFQYEFALPQRHTNDILQERLSESVERFNAAQDPAERIELHYEITNLRQRLRE